MSETPSPAGAEPETEPDKKNSALLEPSDYNQFLLHSRTEILAVLRSLGEHVSQITIFFNEGKDLLLTSLISADNDGLMFDFGASAEMNRKAQEVDKLFCIASLDKVKIQFILRGLTRVEYQGRPAFRAELPDTVLRLQRREYYRLTMPVTRPLNCMIPLPDKDGQADSITVHVVDISGGGAALVAPPDYIPFETDSEFTNCRIDLPEIGTVVATLRVKSVFEITLRSGTVLKRSGCEFVKMPGPMQTLIQRYIIKVERERKARESGLA
ncbi:MAG: flagellar brake protein [Rhodocyclaceae bacterium]|nr:MAG: flagellar brake protein [Rhodocyclaceae bacterium]